MSSRPSRSRRAATLAVLCSLLTGAPFGLWAGDAAAATGNRPAKTDARRGVTAARRTAVPDSALAVFDGGYVFPREFTRSWWTMSPDQYPPGDGLKSRITFLSQIVDRKLIEREVAKGHYILNDAERAELQHTRETMIQNALFDEMILRIPEPTPEELETYKRRLTTLAEVRFVTFADEAKARSWRSRIALGTPVSALDRAIQEGGAAFATADSFRFVAAEQIPDTLATVIWAMRPGQASEVHSFGGEPTIILVRTFAPRPARAVSEPGALRTELQHKRYDRARERFRTELAESLQRTFDDQGMAILLKAHLQIPPRNDVDSLSGVPIMRPNLPVPTIAPADTGHMLARIRGQSFTIGDYLGHWSRVQPFARPEVRERLSLEGAVDRVVLAGEILRLGIARRLDHSPAIEEQVDRMRRGFELDHYFQEGYLAKVRVTDAVLRKAWAKDPAHYNDRASIDSHLMVLERRTQADSLLNRVREGASFSELARTFSMDGASGAQGGRVDTRYRGTQENAGLEDAMFATPVGGYGGPERTPQGWVIWRIDARTPGVTRSFEQARTMVERDYRITEADRRLSARLAALRRGAHVRLFPERVTVDLGKGGPWGD